MDRPALRPRRGRCVSLRLFAAPLAPHAGQRVVLDPEESHYLRRVRRARDGALVDLIDGHGAIWRAEVRGGDARQSELELHHPLLLPTPPRRLTLLLGLPDPAAALTALTDATELGVDRIVLVRCARSQAAAPSPARIERTLRASQRQCGRPSPPTVSGPLPLDAALAALTASDARFFAWEALRGQSDPSTLPLGHPALLLVGPEGGLTDAEADALRAAAFHPLSLGPWTLRTETAALVGLTRLLFSGTAPPV
jgi:16S rRNA (uracil1498-N3)-methyltransferase